MSNNSNQHSPLPWTYDWDDERDCTGIIDADLTRIVGRVRTDNAEFIVRAVNCHDKLVATIQKCEQIVHRQSGQGLGEYDRCELSSQLRAVLAAIQGEST